MVAWQHLPSAAVEDLDGPEEQDFEEDEELGDEDLDDDDAADPYEEYDDQTEEFERRHHPRREEWDG